MRAGLRERCRPAVTRRQSGLHVVDQTPQLLRVKTFLAITATSDRGESNIHWTGNLRDLRAERVGAEPVEGRPAHAADGAGDQRSQRAISWLAAPVITRSWSSVRRAVLTASAGAC